MILKASGHLVELGGLDQRRDGSGAVAVFIGAREDPVAPPCGHGPKMLGIPGRSCIPIWKWREAGRRSQPRQGDAAGRDPPENMKPGRFAGC